MKEESKKEQSAIRELLVSKIHRWNRELEKGKREADKQLEEITKAYSELAVRHNNEVETLETLKRKLSGQLSYYGTLYSTARSHFEGTNYLEGSRKWLKSFAMAEIVRTEEGLSAAAAERIVYDSFIYSTGIDIIERMREIFLGVETNFKRGVALEKNIIQSISIINKEI